VLSAADPEEALRRLGRFRVLCALRRGELGVEGVNTLTEGELASRGLIDSKRGRWYRGRPVMITRNDYGLRLFNGDVGIAFPDPGAGGDLRVFFATPDGGLRAIAPSRLPEHETAYALTVHKSQGSEFEEVLLVLGAQPSRVLTRELVYTGLTRARKRVEVWGTEEALLAAASRRVERSSGLREALWG
jgi:exodeoxyribonuclease V alpha subunit